jgi:uncharacterized protein (TIGR03435 family)
VPHEIAPATQRDDQNSGVLLTGDFMRIWICTTLLTVSAVPVLAQQQITGFPVATVKRNVSDLPYSLSQDRPDGLALVNERVRDIIRFALGLYDFQLIGAPEWATSERFDISARAEGPLSLTEKRVRLQQLLRERFGLRIRTEMREDRVYALTKKSGSSPQGIVARDCDRSGVANLACGRGLQSPDGGIMRMGGVPIQRLVIFLGDIMGRVVTDETGLTGVFDIDLQFRPDTNLSPDFTDDAKQRIEARASLPAALVEQLGLELQPRRTPIRFTIVEALTRPTAD